MQGPYHKPLLTIDQSLFFAGCVAVIAVFAIFSKRRKTLLLGAAMLVAAWQGGVWAKFIKMDVGLVHFIFFALFVLILSDGRKRAKVWRHGKSLLIPWMLLTFWTALSVTKAIDVEQATRGPVNFLFCVLIFWVIVQLARTPREFRIVLMLLAISIIGQSILALLQYKFGRIKFGLIDTSATWMWWRARGTFFHPNHLGFVLLFVLPILLRGAIAALASQDRKLLAYTGIAFALGGTALLTTYNRGSWIGFAVGILLMICVDLIGRGGKLKRFAVAFLIIGALFGSVAGAKFGGLILDRLFQSNQDQILQGRLAFQDEAIERISNHPVLGVGYFNEKYYARVIFVHNLYLLVAAETGVPGIAFFLIFFGSVGWMVYRLARSRYAPVANYARGYVASLVGFAIAAIPGPDFWINPGVQYYIWFALAMLVSLGRIDKMIGRQHRRVRPQAQQQAPGVPPPIAAGQRPA